MLKRFLLYSFALYALVSCRNEDIPERSSEQESDILYASAEQFDHSRTGLGSGNEVLWTKGDGISVFNHRSFNDEYLLKNGYEGCAAGEFKRVPSLIDDFQEIVPFSHSVAFYPYSSELVCNATEDGYVLEGWELPYNQQWVPESFAEESFPMAAASDSPNDISFRNLCGILKLRLTGTMMVDRIVLAGNNGEALAGKLEILVYPDGSEPEIFLQQDSETEVILDCGDGVQLDMYCPADFLFVLPPTEFKRGFTFKIECTGGEIYEISTAKKNPVLRSKILRMPDLDLDALAAEKDNEAIVFEDPVVEDVFVAHFDANGDHAISVAEAGNIRSIGAFFFGDDAGRVRSLNDLVYLKSLSHVSDDAFNGCSLLESVTLPESVKTIGQRAFADCASLSSVTLNDGLEAIGVEAFRSCYNLFEIHLPSSLTTIGEGVFKDCINIERFYGTSVAADGRTLCCGNVLIAYAFSAQAKFAYQVPATVERIGDAAFYNCRNILSFSLHEDVRSIGSEAFFGCGLLADIDLDTGLEDIGEMAFARCFSLKEITIPGTVSQIGYNAFADKTALQKLYVRSAVPPQLDRALFDEVPEGLKIYVPRQSLNEYLASSVWLQMRAYIQGFDFDGGGNDDGDDNGDGYVIDGEVNVLQKASVGNGINIVLMGDAFIDDDIKDGTYASYMKQAMESLFSAEPYTTYRKLFNVYAVNVVSDQRGYAYGTGKLETYFGDATHVGGNDGTVMEYALNVLTADEMDDALIVVLMNRKYYAGTCYMYYHFDGDYGRGLSIAYFPLGTDDEMFSQLLLHEAAGHGFAKLDDEYSYDGRMPSSEMNQHRRLAEYGWHRNVDLTSDWETVKWTRFLYDSRYSEEGLGVYEGASTYRYGAYRPTKNSIMNENIGGFNAPSREAIWYRMHKLAYGESWEYDYEEFVEYDKINLKNSGRSVSDTRITEDIMPPLAPPVVREGSWRDFKYKYQRGL